LFHVFIVYSLLAFGDLFRHVWRVERALGRGDLEDARMAIGRLVGRDTDRMDAGACRRAAIESMSEGLPDGYVSAIFWYVLLGLPGLIVFKVVSTMDSMVGYRTPRYLRFGWCGARLDDAMNFIPARLSWLLIGLGALVVPKCSPAKALAIGYRQAGLLPSPNSGWPEAATAGAIRRRLVGPIWRNGQLVTDIWIGDSNDPPASERADIARATAVVLMAGLAAVVLAVAALLYVQT
jgi:adenosylcobinamide-phosphate synthase